MSIPDRHLISMPKQTVLADLRQRNVVKCNQILTISFHFDFVFETASKAVILHFQGKNIGYHP